MQRNQPPASGYFTALGLLCPILIILFAGVSLYDGVIARAASLPLIGDWLQLLSPALWATMRQPLCANVAVPLPAYALMGSGVIGTLWGMGMTWQSRVYSHWMHQQLQRDQQRMMALQQREEYYRQLCEGMPALVCRFLPDSTLTYVNPAYSQHFNCQPEELQGQRFLELLPNEAVRQTVQSYYQSLTPDHPSVTYEHAILCADGSEGWQRWVDRAFFDSQGRVTHYQSIGLDITDRRRVENELQEQQARLALALEAANMGTWEANLVTGEEIWSPQSQAIFGFAPGTFDGQRDTFFQRVHPEDVEMLQNSGKTALKTGILRDDFRVILPDNRIRWVDCLGKVFYDDLGQPVRMVGVDVDITERKQIEESLRVRAQQQSAVAQLGQMALATTDLTLLMDQATILVAEGLGVEYAKVLERLPDDTGLLLRAGVGWKPGLVGQLMIPLATGSQADYTLALDEPVIVEDWQSESRFQGSPLLHDHQVVSGLSVVIHGSDRPFGVLGAHSTQHRSFTQNDVDFLQAVANTLAAAIGRKQAEVTLRQQKELLQTIFDHLPVMVLLYSVTGEVLVLNRELEQVIGWAKDDYQRVNVLKECYPDPVEYERAIAHIAAANSTWQDFKIRVRDGRVLDTTWPQIRLSDGRLLGIGQDITQRKQAEQALQTSEQRYRAIVEDQAELLLRWAPDRTVRFVNQAYCQFYGLVREEFIGQDFLITVPATIRDWLQAELEAIVCSLTPENPTGFLENWVVDATGEFHYYHFSDLGIFDADGHLVEIQTVGYDITDRKRAEDALQESETRFRQLAENIQEVFWLSDTDLTQMLYVSPAYETVWGRTCASLYDNPASFVEAIHPDDRERVVTVVQQHRTQGWEQEYRIAHPDGNLRWIWEQAFPVADGTGQIRRVVGICQDISDRKQAELEIRQLNDALEQQNRNLEVLVDQRTAELMHRTTQLEASNKELESFSYSVSHDLRAPLRHIHGFVNALTQRLEIQGALADPKVTHYLQVIESSSQKMALLIDGLLTLSRIGRKPLDPHPVCLRDLVNDAIVLAQSSADPAHPTEFIIGALPTVQGDATLLQQVLTNLIGNAVKFSRNHPSPRVEISSLPEGTIVIRDNGVGFQMEYADKLFGAFQRLHNQAAFEGTGIGLAIVQRVIHRHGGTIWAESQPEQGATFYFTIGDFS